MKMLVGAGMCAALVGAGLGAFAVPASACPAGTVPSHFEGVCVSGPAGGQAVAPGPSSGGGLVLGNNPNELPTVNGIPCTPQKIGTCLGLMQSQG